VVVVAVVDVAAVASKPASSGHYASLSILSLWNLRYENIPTLSTRKQKTTMEEIRPVTCLHRLGPMIRQLIQTC